MAFEKWKEVAGRKYDRPYVIVSSDTIVSVKGRILGKPKNKQDAKRMLNRLSGCDHYVYTAVVVGWNQANRPLKYLSQTKIRFRKISSSELEGYLRSHEWKDKAGAYAIQGRAQSFLDALYGSWTCVIGLPLSETISLVVQCLTHPPGKQL